MASVTDVGAYEVTATYTDGEAIGRASKQFEIKQAAFSGTKDFEENVIATDEKTYTFELPQNVTSLKDVKFGTPTGMSAVVKSAKVEGNKLIITTKTATSGSDTITILVTSKNYESFNLTYKFTASGKQDVSSSITFTSDTVTYDGKNHKLSEPGFTGTVEGTKNWTYTWYKDNVKATTIGQSTRPEFKDVGVYHVTAKYEDDKQIGSKEATLTIKPAAVKSTITVTATQMSSSKDDNYKYWDLDERDSGDGYLNLRADADDYLVNQKKDGTSSEWIGMTIEPKVGSSRTTDGLWVAFSKTGTWYKLKDISSKRNGDLYITDVDSDSFDLWFDTDDRDRTDSIYLATNSAGTENLFELEVDFDSYSGSSSSSSGSSSSDTSKVDGDRVSTTTVDKTPSVKNGSATVTFSSSALSDALDENKKEAKREDADKTYIELDVKTSKSVDDTTITVPRSSLDKLADEDTGLKLTTNQGTVTFDYRALAEIYDACDKTNIEFYLEEEDDDQYVLLIKDGSSDVIDLGRGSVEVTFDYKLKSGEKSSDVKVYRIGNGDKTWLATYGGSTVYGAADVYAAAPTYVTDMKADYSSSKKKVTFTTDALGTFLITTDTLKTGSGSTTTTPTYNAFVDVPSSRWSATYINKLASLGIINGTGGGYFEPTLYVTREEFVKMLAGVAGANVTGYTSSRFPDVPLSRWSAPYIAWAADRGITTGTMAATCTDHAYHS
ncbi:MAG: S-layer homology domain-containing protein [Butyricicoccus pullicaecorum]